MKLIPYLYIIFLHVNVVSSGLSMVPGFTADTTDAFINGWEYRMSQVRNGHPFLYSRFWEDGVLESELTGEETILMNYDIHKDIVVVQLFREGRIVHIALNPLYIKNFSFNKRQFIQVAKYYSSLPPDVSGYYELAWDGNLQLLLKWKKEIAQEEGVERGSSYKQSKYRWIIYEGNWFEIKNKRDIYSVFPIYKPELKKYIKENQIYFRREGSLENSGLMKYIDTLIENKVG